MLLKNLKKINRPSSILIVGFGNIAFNIDKDNRKVKFSHFSALKELKLVKNVKAILDDNIKKIEFPKAFRKVKKFEKINHLNKEFKQFDLVIVLVPTVFCVKVTKKLIKNISFKHLMLEKPISTSLKEFDSLNKLLSKNKIIWTINYQRNWDKNINYLKEFIAKYKPYLVSIETSGAIIQSGSHFIELCIKLFPNIVPVIYNDTSNRHRFINNKKDPNGIMVLKNNFTTVIISFLGSSKNLFKSNITLKSDKNYLIYNEVKGTVSLGKINTNSSRFGKNCEYDEKPNKIFYLSNKSILKNSYMSLFKQNKTNLKLILRARRVIEIFSKFKIKYL